MKNNSGFLLILSGPAGAGKTTIARRLCGTYPECILSVSATTRLPRSTERHGIDYFFMRRDEFEADIKNDEFAEHAEFSGNLYGTPKHFLDGQIAEGNVVVLDIEVKGAAQIRRHYPNAVKVFLLPPSPEKLIERLVGRGTESKEEISRRMEIARSEILRMEEYDYFVVNDDVDKTFAAVSEILSAERRRIRGGECEVWLGGRKPEDVLKA